MIHKTLWNVADPAPQEQDDLGSIVGRTFLDSEVLSQGVFDFVDGRAIAEQASRDLW